MTQNNYLEKDLNEFLYYTHNKQLKTYIYKPVVQQFLNTILTDYKSKNDMYMKQFRYVKYLQKEVRNYMLNYNNYQNHNKLSVYKARFNNLVTSFEVKYKTNTNALYTLDSITKKIVHFVNLFYNDINFYKNLRTFPYKVVLEYDNVFDKVFVINNIIELKEMFLSLMLVVVKISSQIDDTGNIEYIVGDADEIETENLTEDELNYRQAKENNDMLYAAAQPL
jgi:hypothetical protein